VARRARIALAVMGIAGVMAAAPAWADDLKGQWLFDTSVFDGDCKITGQMTFTPAKAANTYTCVFISEQICGPKHPELQSIKVQQDCTATKIGSQVAVKSVVNHVIARKPMVENPADTYYADNFIVTMSKGLNEMLGGHYDVVRQLKAHFWRDVALIS
jgi:hypothetical protein